MKLFMSYDMYGLKMTTSVDGGACRVRLPARPVVSKDGTKLYFAELEESYKVKFMDYKKYICGLYRS
ncbi:MAG: hypothetical protein KatS3mg083_428 [Candidatus Dojkabacteria bacterium]|nr:MAG: hypothetical protein KatS3mg083_428 [Candidatus Dojkabacteria bacterium]